MLLSMPLASSKGNEMNRNLRLKMTIQILLVAVVILAFVLLPCCSASTERQIQVPALKRIASLGDLYNANIDHIINVGVFRRQIPTEHISKTQNPTQRTDAGILNLLENQFKLFSIDANEAVNILTGITTARGAARILNHKKQFSQLRGTLTYKYQTVTTSLWAFHEGLTNTNLYNKDILRHIEATHVVTSITWGATVAVTLDASSIETHDDIPKIQNSLNKELRNLRGKFLPSDEINSNFSMSITSDVPLPNEIPTTAKEVKEILHQVPTLIAGINQGKGIPLQYTLTPINMIRKHMGVNMQNITGHKINDFTLSEIIDAFQDLRSAEDRIHEIREQINGHPNCVSPQTAATMNFIVSNFQNFKNNLTTTLKKSVVDVRLGLQENQVLSDLLEDFRNSEFSLENLNYKFLNLSSTIENTALCNTIQNEFSQIQYIGAGDDFISKLTTLQKSNTSVLVMFTNSEFIRNQPETYFESLNSLLKKQKERTNVCLFVNCDFSNSRLCNDLNDTFVFEYANETYSPSFQKRKIEENIRILELEATVVDLRKEMLNLQNFGSILEYKLVCGLSPCLNSGNCTFQNNERQCECLAGFLGDNCETNVDDCAGRSSCLNGATCVDGTSSFSCACAPGFTSNHCETNIDDCAGHNSYLNGATCVDGTGSFSCACAPGFTGNHCGTNIDDCAGHNRCLNGGTCVDRLNSFSCVCTDEYVGNYCETPACSLPESEATLPVIHLDCGGLIQLPNFPQKFSSALLEYKSKNLTNAEHCLWTFNNVDGNNSHYLIRIQVKLQCEEFVNSGGALSVLDWKEKGSDWILSNNLLRKNGDTFKHNGWDWKVFLSYSSGISPGSSFVAQVNVLQVSWDWSGSNFAYTSAIGTQNFGPYARHDKLAIVVNPSQNITTLTVDDLDSKRTTSCYWEDTLDIFEIQTAHGPQRLARLCGEVTTQPSYTSNYPLMVMYFTRKSTSGRGFQISWK